MIDDFLTDLPLVAWEDPNFDVCEQTFVIKVLYNKPFLSTQYLAPYKRPYYIDRDIWESVPANLFVVKDFVKKDEHGCNTPDIEAIKRIKIYYASHGFGNHKQ